MEFLMTGGLTIFTVHSHGDSSPFVISVLSCRAAKIAIKKSLRGTWEYPIVPYTEIFGVDDFWLVGFQPEKGRHIAVSKLK